MKYPKERYAYGVRIISVLFVFAIISAGMASQSYAQQGVLLTVNTDKAFYEEGDVIVISGKVLPRYSGTLTIMIISPNNSVVSVGQPNIDINNTFSMELSAGGTIKIPGNYTVRASYSYGVHLTESETVFEYATVKTLNETDNGMSFQATQPLSAEATNTTTITSSSPSNELDMMSLILDPQQWTIGVYVGLAVFVGVVCVVIISVRKKRSSIHKTKLRCHNCGEYLKAGMPVCNSCGTPTKG